jgi:ribonuclease BN (tRNA processing enzyme)
VDALTLTPVGVGFAYSRPGEAQSAYLVTRGRRAVCLDLGAGALNRLQELVAPEALDALVVTHTHPDHFADLLALRVYMRHGPGLGRRLRVIGPPGLRDLLVGVGGDGWDEAFAFELLDPDATVAIAPGMRLTCAPVPHGPPTFAVRIDGDGGGSVTYGADCMPNDALPRLAARTDILLAECSEGAGPRDPDGVHLSAMEAAQMAVAAGAGRLLLTHCAPQHDRDAALAVARGIFPGPVDWARQGEAVAASAG